MKQRIAIFIGAAFTVVAAFGYSLRAQDRPVAKAGGMEFVKIPAGEFMMGCSPGDNLCNTDESPRHRVQITKSFEIGKYEVTQAQWTALMQTNPSSVKGDNRPVETVSKLEAQTFVAKLNAANDGYRYRLPTEAEWEYSARAGMDSPHSGPIDQVAWYSANSEDETHPVGQKKPNTWGLYDMQGNVREWVSDFYSSNYYSVSPAADPTGAQLGGDRGGPGPRGRGGRGGPGGPGGLGRGGPQGPPPNNQQGASQQQQIDALRQQVEDLQRQVQQLQIALQAGPFRGGPNGPAGPAGPAGPGPNGPGRGPQGPQQGPAVAGPDGQFIDPLDGLPTGLPVARGGGWDQSAPFQRVSARYSYYGPTLKVSDIGFRLVRVPVGQ